MPAIITQLNIYPVKSCRGIALAEGLLTDEGLEYDRQWMIVASRGEFLTQRELPRLALIGTSVRDDVLMLTVPGTGSISVPPPSADSTCSVRVWRDNCRGFDCGEDIARILTRFLERDVRLVKFDPSAARYSDRKFTAEIAAPLRFSDGFPILLIAEESLEDLNARLPAPLPMNRFRPNIVIKGLGPYSEDRVHEFRMGAVTLRVVKPCMRCKITATDQATAEVDKQEPLRSLKKYRWNRILRGAAFGQNVVVAAGVNHSLRVAQPMEVSWRA
jgi:uncharacterized protein